MTVTTLRPNSDDRKVNFVHSTGTNAAALVDDGGNVQDFTGADDATYVVGNESGYPNSYAILGLTTASVAADQRILRLRIRARGRMNAADAGRGGAIYLNLRDPNSGQGTGRKVIAEAGLLEQFKTANASSFVPFTGTWRSRPPANDGPEWLKAILDRLQVSFYWVASSSPVTVSKNLRVSEVYVDVDIRDRPEVQNVAVTGFNVTSRPRVAWEYVPNADGDKQVAYQVAIFTLAQFSAANFNPTSSLAAWRSGERFGISENLDVERDLANGGTYRAYVRAAQDFNGTRWYSDWVASSNFTVGTTPPATPSLTVTADPTVPNLRTALQAAALLNTLPADDADFEGGAGNWQNGQGWSAVASSATQARHGTQSLALTSNGTASPNARNTANAGAGATATRPGQQHTLSGFVRANTTGRAMRLVLRWHDADNNFIAQNNGSSVVDASGAWTAFPDVTASAPGNATRVYAQVECTATPANGEIHFVDQLQINPGPTSPDWMPGFFATSSLVLERAVAHKLADNLAGRQLYGGGDARQSTDGFHTTGTVSRLLYDPADRIRGIGSIRWEVEDTAADLLFGWPSGTFEDPDPDFALAAVPGRTYTFSLYARTTSSNFSSQLNLQAIDKDGAAVGSPTNGGAISILTSGWTRFSASITVPAGAAYVRPHLDNSASVTGRRVWVDGLQWELGTSLSALTQPGGQELVWEPVRGYGPDDFPVPPIDQATLAFDHEVPPGQTVLYRGWVYAADPNTGEIVASALTAYTPILIDPPGVGQWVLSETSIAPMLRGRVRVLPGITESQEEQQTAYHPIRPRVPGQVGQRPVVLSDFIGGHDGSLTLAALSDDDWLLLEELLALQAPLWLAEARGGGRFLRVTGRSWGRTRFREQCATLADGTVLETDEWERTVTVTYLESGRPP